MKKILKRLGVAAFVFWILFVASFLFPATREMHVLCLRLLLPFRGNTYVRGQEPGCVLQTIPNVSFTDRFIQELRRDARLSPDSYIQACSAGSYSEIQFPDAALWKDHPLLQWAALRFVWINRDGQSSATNSYKSARLEKFGSDLIHLAQKSYLNNGALWLAEASHEFGAGREQSALDALRIAAEKGKWSLAYKASFDYIKRLMRAKGLSELDAAIAANNLAPDFSALTLQGTIKRTLIDRMTEAVIAGDDRGFSTEMERLQSLQKPTWFDSPVANRFQIFSPGDEFLNALALRMGRETVPK